MSVAAKKLTWDDIKYWPEYHGRTEIVDGELVMSPVPGRRHQRVCMRLGALIEPFVEEHALGEFYALPLHVILAEDAHYEPDLCFISKERLHILREAVVQGPPDLIIEVISESNRTHDTVVKFRDYALYGVQEYWLVDPREEHIRTFILEGSSAERGHYVALGVFGRGDTVVSRAFRDLTLDPAQVF